MTVGDLITIDGEAWRVVALAPLVLAGLVCICGVGVSGFAAILVYQ